MGDFFAFSVLFLRITMIVVVSHFMWVGCAFYFTITNGEVKGGLLFIQIL